MICESCKNAGQALTRGSVTVAKLLHLDCKAKTTCTCQHVMISVFTQPQELKG